MRWALVWLMALSSAASAQEQREPTQTEMAAARELFRTGLAHARAGEWEAAHSDFERSYAIAQVPTTLLNLAGAQAQTGKMIAASASYRRFLRDATSGRAREYREQAESALRDLDSLTPRVRLEVTGLVEGDVLHIDGEEMSTAVLGTPIPLDPGDHVASLHRRGNQVAERSFSLMRAEQSQVTLTVPDLRARLDPSEDDVIVDTGLDDDRSIASSPWLWIGVGAVVIGAVLGGVLLSRGGDDPFRGNLGRATFE